MKTRSVRALTYLAETTANAQEQAKLSTQTQAQGNRKDRRKQKLFNKLLNRKIRKMSDLGPVDVSIGSDGIPHVKVKKNAAAKRAKEQLEEIKKNPEAMVSGPGRVGLGPRPLGRDDSRVLVVDAPSSVREVFERHVVEGRELEQRLDLLLADE